MNDVVARKKNSVGIGYIAMIVIGVLFIGIFVGLGIVNKLMGSIVIGLIIGLIFIAVGVWQTVIFFKYPKEIITYRDGVLNLAGKYTCSPLDITGTKRIVTRRNGIVDRWGKLEITLFDGRKYVLKYVDEVEAVQERLSAIKAECVENIEKQNVAKAPDAPAENNPDADPFGL